MSSTSRTEFLDELRRGLSALPAAEAEKSVSFYAEMIDDRVEYGESEADAVAAMGDAGEVARTIIAELPAVPKAIVKSKTKSATANWVLAVVLSPIWVSLAIVALALVFSVYVTIWALAFAVWAVAIALLCCGPMGLAVAVYCLAVGDPVVAAWQLGAGLACFGLGMLCLVGAKKASVWFIDVSRRYVGRVRSWFVKDRGAEGVRAKEGAYVG